MSVEFGTPSALALLLLVPLLLWLARGRVRSLAPAQRRLAIVLRAVIFLALVGTLANPKIGRPDESLGLVFAVDPQMWIPEEKIYVRVEDTVAVTASGIEVLTADAPLDPDAVEKTVGVGGLLQAFPPLEVR